MLVIADQVRPQAIAGIMGGLDSEVGDETRTVVLESANFEPRAIRQTSRALRMATEASKRFDKGLDPEMTVVAAARAAALMVELGGGVAATGLVDVYPGVAPPREVVVTPEQIAGLLGRRYEVEEIERVLTNLQFGVERADGALRVRVPTFRRDVVGKADIAEEVARITGYDQIPPALPKGQLPPPRRDLTRHWEEVVKATLVGCGYQEVITYSLVDPLATQKLDAAAPWPNVEPRGDMVAVYNPMSVEQSFLRTSLLPSLLATLAANLRHAERVYLFELARVYLPPLEPLPRERRRLGVVFCGDRYPTGWDVPHAPGDFFDLKGAIEEVLEALRVRDATFRPAVHPSLHPGRTAELAAVDATGHERSLGFLGQVHPRVAERFDLEGREVYAAEIDFDDLLLFASEELTVRPLPRFPAVALDIAVVVDEDVPHRRVEREVREAGGLLLEAVRLFDVYRGAPVPAGRKSLAYALTFRAPDRTLTEAEALEVRERIVQRLREQVGATIRGQDHA
jgi:phenylalanyl-tRNA synthetase beta chain